MRLKPWARGPFELIRHAEGHLKQGTDFDRRMALISFDNAIEMSIISYLSLNPIQRSDQIFKREDVDRWSKNYHSKLEFFEYYVEQVLSQKMKTPRDEIIYYHNLRNELYHKGNGFVPQLEDIQKIREISLWIFSTLFEVAGEDILLNVMQDNIAAEPAPPPYGDSESLSDRTQFLKQFISIRHKLEELSGQLGLPSESKDLSDTLEAIVKEGYEEKLEEFLEVFNKAERIRDLIVDDTEEKPTEVDLEQVSKKVEEASEFLDFKLRYYQREAAEKAFQESLKALTSNERQAIGVVSQASGTGLFYTFFTYLALATSADEFQNFKLLVLTQSIVMLEQLKHMLPTSFEETVPLCVPKSRVEMKNCLKSKNYRVVLSNIQKLMKKNGEEDFEDEKIIVIGYNLNNAPAPLMALFPNSKFLLFTSSYVNQYHIVSAFGYHISRYGREHAIKDGVILPVRVERRAWPLGDSDEKNLGTSLSSMFNDSTFINRITRDIIEHYESRDIDGGKAIVIAPNQKAAIAIFESIIDLRPQWKESGKVHAIVGDLDPVEYSLFPNQFNDENSPFSIAIMADLWILGIDIPTLKAIYVLKKLSKTSLYQLFSKVNRIHGDKQYGLIVDYLGQDFESLGE